LALTSALPKMELEAFTPQAPELSLTLGDDVEKVGILLAPGGNHEFFRQAADDRDDFRLPAFDSPPDSHYNACISTADRGLAMIRLTFIHRPVL